MNRKIMWSSQHLEIDTMSGQLTSPNDEDDNNYYEREEEDESHPGGDIIHNVISTPFGLWKVNDIMNPYKQFKLWMGHTNFTINKNVASIIKAVPGIEVLSILTRYRFLIGIGEMFSIRDVRTMIERRLKCSKIGNRNIRKKIINNEIKPR